MFTRNTLCPYVDIYRYIYIYVYIYIYMFIHTHTYSQRCIALRSRKSGPSAAQVSSILFIDTLVPNIEEDYHLPFGIISYIQNIFSLDVQAPKKCCSGGVMCLNGGPIWGLRRLGRETCKYRFVEDQKIANIFQA